jgi:cytochrome c peroxidase
MRAFRIWICSATIVWAVVPQCIADAAPGATFSVRPGQSIQTALDRAQPGDRVEVYPGVYHESLSVDKNGITLIGVTESGDRPVLDGEKKLADGVVGAGSNFTMAGFRVRNYQGNGVSTSKATNVTFRDLILENPGLYGVYPVECQGVLIESCVVSGASDAGLYVGQSRDIVVRNCEAYNNVAGIEIENSVNAIVSNNSAHHNTGGILVFVLPNNPSKEGKNCRVIHNRIWANNHENFGKPGTTVSFIPPGIGMFVMAADNTEITQNELADNGSYAISVLSLTSSRLPAEVLKALDVEPNSDSTFIHGNTYTNNGKAPSAAFTAAYGAVPPGDLYWDGTGNENKWGENSELATFPVDLLSKSIK